MSGTARSVIVNNLCSNNHSQLRFSVSCYTSLSYRMMTPLFHFKSPSNVLTLTQIVTLSVVQVFKSNISDLFAPKVPESFLSILETKRY